jgi:peptidoglycan/LPS O-acetylase OafA/YrhL
VTTFYKNGWQGVELFFAISGFIIGLPFAKQYILGGRKISYKSYFLRRVTRLEPPYLIMIILLYFLFAMLGKFTLSERFTSLLASMVYMNNVIFQDLNKLVLSVIWSLEIEVQFYVLAIIFAKVFMLPKLWRRLAIMAVIVGFPYLQKLYYPSVNTIYLYIQFFFIGFLLADLYLDEKRPKIPEILGMIMGLATIYVLLFVNHANGIGNHFLYLGSMIVFYYMAMHNKFWKKIMSIRWVAIIGGMCYTIYLIHGPVIGIVGDIGEYLKISDSYMPNLLLNTLISIPLVLFFSGLYFRLVERPCMDKTWPQKLWSFLRSKFSTVASDK